MIHHQPTSYRHSSFSRIIPSKIVNVAGGWAGGSAADSEVYLTLEKMVKPLQVTLVRGRNVRVFKTGGFLVSPKMIIRQLSMFPFDFFFAK